MAMETRKFTIDIPETALQDLRDRLGRTRFPGEIADADWGYGTDLAYLRDLVAYWKEGYDWRAHESRLNQLNQSQAKVDDLWVHFVHEKGKGPSPMPPTAVGNSIFVIMPVECPLIVLWPERNA